MSKLIDLVSEETAFLSSTGTLVLLRRSSRFGKLEMCSCGVLENTTISSRYASSNGHFTINSMTTIVLWNTPDEFCSPKGMRLEIYSS